MNRRWVTMLVASVGLLPLASRAADWPQWRGPERNGISPETGLLKEWPEGGPKQVWQVKDVGGGYSTPAVVGDRIYLLGNEGMDDEFVQARSVNDGKKLWQTRIGKVAPNRGPQYPGARSTPTVVGDVLYALGSDGDLVCLETKGGKERWKKNLRTDFGGKPGNWAYSESPLIDGDVLVVAPGGSEATIVALNAQTGETVWKTALPEGDEAAYASAVITEAAGKKQYVEFLQKGVVGVDAETGKLLWRYGRTAEGSPANILTPVVDDNFVYTAASRSGGGLVRIEVNGGSLEAEEVYFSPKLPKSIGGAVKIGDELYGTTDVLVCADFATGEIKWQDRGVGAASVCYADGHLYLHDEKTGEVVLVEASPEGYSEKGRFTPSAVPERDKERSWAYPAIANGRLYIRDLNALWAYDIEDGREKK